jgi:hypothetical protein
MSPALPRDRFGRKGAARHPASLSYDAEAGRSLIKRLAQDAASSAKGIALPPLAVAAGWDAMHEAGQQSLAAPLAA